MKSTVKYWSMCIVLLSIGMISCNEEVIYSGLKGKIRGTAFYRELNEIMGEGIRVEAIKDGKIINFVYTDSTGAYEIDDLETGIYDFKFSKDSFSIRIIQSYQFIGGDFAQTLPYLYLDKLNFNQISNFHIDTTDYKLSYGYFFWFDLDESDVYDSYNLVISKDPEVYFGDYQYVYQNLRAGFYKSTYYVSLSPRFSEVYMPGDTLYARLYPAIRLWYNIQGVSYYDTKTGLPVYPVNEQMGSDVISFVFKEN